LQDFALEDLFPSYFLTAKEKYAYYEVKLTYCYAKGYPINAIVFSSRREIINMRNP